MQSTEHRLQRQTPRFQVPAALPSAVTAAALFCASCLLVQTQVPVSEAGTGFLKWWPLEWCWQQWRKRWPWPHRPFPSCVSCSQGGVGLSEQT